MLFKHEFVPESLTFTICGSNLSDIFKFFKPIKLLKPPKLSTLHDRLTTVNPPLSIAKYSSRSEYFFKLAVSIFNKKTGI